MALAVETRNLTTPKPAITAATHVEFDSEDIIVVKRCISEEWKFRRQKFVISGLKNGKQRSKDRVRWCLYPQQLLLPLT